MLVIAQFLDSLIVTQGNQTSKFIQKVEFCFTQKDGFVNSFQLNIQGIADYKIQSFDHNCEMGRRLDTISSGYGQLLALEKFFK